MVLELTVRITVPPKVINRFSAIGFKIPKTFLEEVYKCILKCLWNPNESNLEKEQRWKAKCINRLLFPYPLPINASFSTTTTTTLPRAHQTQKCCPLLLCLPSHLALAHHLLLYSSFMSPITPCSHSN